MASATQAPTKTKEDLQKEIDLLKRRKIHQQE
jgi:hypothetical protein